MKFGQRAFTDGPGTNDGNIETQRHGWKDIENGRKENVLTIKRMEEKFYMGWYVADYSMDRINNPYCSMVRGYILHVDL